MTDLEAILLILLFALVFMFMHQHSDKQSKKHMKSRATLKKNNQCIESDIELLEEFKVNKRQAVLNYRRKHNVSARCVEQILNELQSES